MGKVSFSGRNTSFLYSIEHHDDVQNSLNLFFSAASPLYQQTFFGLTPSDVAERLSERKDELALNTMMSLLASVEATFRVDYLRRCYNRSPKDQITKDLRKIYAKKAERASLEDEILEVWKQNTTGTLISDLRGAFKMRHWLAHGRYWTPKLGREYDYVYVYSLAVGAQALPLTS